MLRSYLPTLSDQELSQLNTLVDLFLEHNQRVNLSAIRDRDGVVIKHVVDSLLALPFLKIEPQFRVLDMGTGGGFPGLALAICFPNSHFTLVDSTQKKLDAVQMMADELGLQNVEILWARAEELAHNELYREQYDVIVSRAFAKWGMNLELCMPFIRPGGQFLAYQGPEIREELKDYAAMIQLFGGHLKAVHEASLPENQGQRCFVEIEKATKTPPAYPRTITAMKKKPLLGQN